MFLYPFGNRRAFIRQNVNAFAAMVISGLWHGSYDVYYLGSHSWYWCGDIKYQTPPFPHRQT